MKTRITKETYAPGPILPRSILRDPALSSQAKVVAAHLLDLVHLFDEVFPGQERMANELDVPPRTIRRAISELKRAGILKVTQRGRGLTSTYEMYCESKQGQYGRPSKANMAVQARPNGPTEKKRSREERKKRSSPSGDGDPFEDMKPAFKNVAPQIKSLVSKHSPNGYRFTKADTGPLKLIWDSSDSLDHMERVLYCADELAAAEDYFRENWNTRLLASKWPLLIQKAERVHESNGAGSGSPVRAAEEDNSGPPTEATREKLRAYLARSGRQSPSGDEIAPHRASQELSEQPESPGSDLF